MNKRFIKATEEWCSFDHHVPAPYLRKSFTLDFVPEKAEISICGLGFYVLYINGVNVTKGMLAPYISNVDHYCYYDTYDIKKHLRQGENVIGIWLGNGFMNPFGGAVWDFDQVDWLGAPRVALECVITDGEKELSFDADQSFRTHPSPVIFDEYRMGEYYDATREIPGWNLPGFDDSAWNTALSAEMPRGELKQCTAEPILIQREIKPVSVQKYENGYLYDFGINTAGLCRLQLKNAKAGQKITMLHSERHKDGKFDISNVIFSSPARLEKYPFYKTYPQKNIYIAKGAEEETYLPQFVYHGFRYVLVEGITEEQATEDLLTYCVMHSDIKPLGGFSCSEENLNKLYRMMQNSVLSNFYYFQTDCPHREKNGWTGDASMSSDYVALMYDVTNSWREWLANIRKAMNDAGALPGIVPTGTWGFDWGNGPAWDSIIFNLPYQLWRLRGNTDLIRENAHCMVRYLEYAMTRRSADGTIAIGLGDWVPVGKKASRYDAPLALTDTVQVMDIAGKAQEMLDAIGYTNQALFAGAVCEDLRETIRRELIDFDTMTVAGDCQTSQVLPIYYGVFNEDEEAAAFEKLLEIIHRDGDSFTSGFQGMHTLFHVLSAFGESELAYHMITKHEYPSYVHLLDLGFTSMPEEFQPDGAECGSHNHHFLGDVNRWFTCCLAGLNIVDPTHVRVAPHFVQTLNYAEAYYDLPAGRAAVKWERGDDAILLTVEVPAGVECTVDLPEDAPAVKILQKRG
ncbi:MAG: family 78 glycoside hydrolase catalytic domain [Clostridia bacterium]|nr:family 78 glycoside hydrolase catalytic domain [Clostridia bacterium]